MLNALKKIWRFAGEEKAQINKSIIVSFFYAVFHMFQISAIYFIVLALTCLLYTSQIIMPLMTWATHVLQWREQREARGRP